MVEMEKGLLERLRQQGFDAAREILEAGDLKAGQLFHQRGLRWQDRHGFKPRCGKGGV